MALCKFRLTYSHNPQILAFFAPEKAACGLRCPHETISASGPPHRRHCFLCSQSTRTCIPPRASPPQSASQERWALPRHPSPLSRPPPARFLIATGFQGQGRPHPSRHRPQKINSLPCRPHPASENPTGAQYLGRDSHPIGRGLACKSAASPPCVGRHLLRPAGNRTCLAAPISPGFS